VGFLEKSISYFKKKSFFKEKVSVKLRVSGWVYIFLTLALGFTAVNSANNVTYLIVSILLSIMSVSGVFALINLSGIEIIPQKQVVFTAGKEGFIGFIVKNKKFIPSLILDINLKEIAGGLPFVSGKKSNTVWLKWLPEKRGVFRFDSLKSGSSFPFGFIWRGMTKKIDLKVLVAPAPYEFELPLYLGPKGQSGQITGRGTGDWIGIRSYKKGEAIGSIVWKKVDWSYRELQKIPSPYPSHHLAAEEIMMVFDINHPMIQGFDTEKKLSILRYWLDHACQSGRQWELKLGERHTKGIGKSGYNDALILLALYNKEENENKYL
jgi:hypothetical protein